MSCPLDITKDHILDSIATYFKVELNRRTPEDLKERGIQLVNTYQLADFPMTSNLEFPLLRLFRQNANFKHNRGGSYFTLSMSYMLTYPELSKLPGILHYVERSAYEIFQEWQFQTKISPYNVRLNSFPTRCEYLTLVSQMRNEIYYGLRWMFQIQE